MFVHVLATCVFCLTHGATLNVTLALRRDRGLERIRALLDCVEISFRWMAWSWFVLVLSGVVLAYLGSWWRQGWVWVALVLSIATAKIMSRLGSQHFNQLRRAAGMPYYTPKVTWPWWRMRKDGLLPDVRAGHLENVLGRFRPLLLTYGGAGALVVLVALMVWKPF